MSKKKIIGGAGITAGGDVTFGDVSGQVAMLQSHLIDRSAIPVIAKNVCM